MYCWSPRLTLSIGSSVIKECNGSYYIGYDGMYIVQRMTRINPQITYLVTALHASGREELEEKQNRVRLEINPGTMSNIQIRPGLFIARYTYSVKSTNPFAAQSLTLLPRLSRLYYTLPARPTTLTRHLDTCHIVTSTLTLMTFSRDILNVIIVWISVFGTTSR